jgi:hypothetical protein
MSRRQHSFLNFDAPLSVKVPPLESIPLNQIPEAHAASAANTARAANAANAASAANAATAAKASKRLVLLVLLVHLKHLLCGCFVVASGTHFLFVVP